MGKWRKQRLVRHREVEEPEYLESNGREADSDGAPPLPARTSDNVGDYIGSK